MASFEGAPPEVQAEARQLAAAIRDRNLDPNNAPRTGDPGSSVRQVSATSLADASGESIERRDDSELKQVDLNEDVASSDVQEPAKTPAPAAKTPAPAANPDHPTKPAPTSTAAKAAEPVVSDSVEVSKPMDSQDKAEANELASNAKDPPESKDDSATISSKDESQPSTTTVELESESPEDLFAALTSEQQIDLLIKRLSSQQAGAVNTPEGLRHEFTARMLHLLAQNADDALRPIPELSANEQEYMRHQLMSIWSVIDPEGSPTRGRRWDAALENLRLASSHLAAAKDSLVVNGIAFCTEVESYGRITPFEKYSFEPGQQVILYCELDHFAAERLSAGYETHFQGSYDIFNAEGVRVAEQVLPADKQTCKNFRRDYFIAYRLYLPKQLQPGSHRIQLTIEDLKGKKYGQSVLDFEVVSKKSSPN